MPVHRHPIAVPKARDPLALLPVDLELVKRLRETYDQLRAEPTPFVEIFYRRLFEAAPQVRPMFKSDAASQSQKLLSALDAVVRNLERPAETAAMLAAMGQRHAAYGAKPEHYDLVVTLLIDAMRATLGARASADRLDEWRQALQLISAQMIAASGHASSKA